MNQIRDAAIERLRVQGVYWRIGWDEAEQARFHELCGLPAVPLDKLDDAGVGVVFERMLRSRMILSKAAGRK
ncbi:MAG: hypothetical protein KF831_10775 [Acidobacteria bacterium]|nr:hypothetical protein [Acidobacteriota bacterium]